LKLPSPFTLTVRASTDYVKVFPKQLPESECLAGLVVSAGVILTHVVGVKMTHLDEDGGFWPPTMLTQEQTFDRASPPSPPRRAQLEPMPAEW